MVEASQIGACAVHTCPMRQSQKNEQRANHTGFKGVCACKKTFLIRFI